MFQIKPIGIELLNTRGGDDDSRRISQLDDIKGQQ